VHITGVDTLEGTKNDEFPGQRGLVFRGPERAQVVVLEPTQLAEALTPKGAEAPAITTLNFRASSSMYAPSLLDAGIDVVIGIHDKLDDLSAEIFFAEFYRRLKLAPAESALTAFVSAWRTFEKQRERYLTGSGIVFWSATRCLRTEDDLQKLRDVVNGTEPCAGARVTGEAGGHFEADVNAFEYIPYLALHSGISPLRRLRVLGGSDDRNHSIDVEIALGTFGAPFRLSSKHSSAIVELKDEVALDISAPILRDASRRESIRSLLNIRIDVDGRNIYQRSHPVLVSPISEWPMRLQRARLPGFVLPNDPVIADVVRGSLAPLHALTQSQKPAFVGLTSNDVQVLQEVKALWYAIINRFALSYVPAAPGTVSSRQRLRLPSDVTEGRLGTCVELALFFASCLEYVKQAPVLVLLTDHVLVGCWKSFDAYSRFLQGPSAEKAAISPNDDDAAWVLSSPTELQERRVDLIWLDPVGLTTQRPFDETVAAAEVVLNKALAGTEHPFEMLLDIRRARDSGVLPLPVDHRTIRVTASGTASEQP
jgi:hypothetical protein